MFGVVLVLHSLVRWLVVIAGVVSAFKFLWGWLGRQEWRPLDGRLAALFPMLLDIQLLLGLLLYFALSPITTGALGNFGAAMSNPIQRFYAVEHIFMMLIALVVAHIGSALVKKRTTATAKFRISAIFIVLAFIIIFLAIPWPYVLAGAGRPWLRLG